ncbi:hypothetical protein BLS_006268 [Venturia inaequalis]|uniref:Uncharacterized protein n=1 Tax=Venturia inaequalis TaxID=5025 RepID=A0A8H3UE76_VENIN|nr:hypothetical protein BLS_006268 [Venturia inaequalis]RDI76613.1 hypothetical protein Vi05172_g13379 [Venturia inaequalis]
MRSLVSLAAAVVSLPTALAAAGCPPLELIYARATTEPKGLGAAGGLLAKDLAKDLPAATVYPVNYPASMGSLNTCEGPMDLIKQVKTRVDSCPGIKLALGGHSQGGAVVTATISKIPAKYLKSIVAVTLFGAPPCSDLTKSTVPGVAEVGARCKSFCNYKDQICDSTGAMGNGGPRASCTLPKSFVPRRRDVEVKDFGLGYPAYVEPRPLSEQESLRVNRFNKQAAATCGEDERGHKAGSMTGLAAHMAYKSDGYYVAAASCYIAKMFKAAGGSGPPAAEAAQ